MSQSTPQWYVMESVGWSPRQAAPWAGAAHCRSAAEIPQTGATLAVVDLATARSLLRDRAIPPVLVLWLGAGDAAEDALLDHPQVVGVVDAQTGDAALHTLRRVAQGRARGGVETDGPSDAETRLAGQFEQVLRIGRALAAEKNLDALLALILDGARALTNADGASVYTLDRDGKLYFRLWQNSSRPNTGGTERRPVGESSIASYVAGHGATVVLEDAYAISPQAPYHFNPAFDQATGYRTRSLLTVAMWNKAGQPVGVLQLINRKQDAAMRLDTPADVALHVQPFTEQDMQIALALAGQAGVALENSMLYADIERLFQGFVSASVAAIEARDPTTAGHSFRVAGYTERLALAVDRSTDAGLAEQRFSRDELREIRFAALLHDFGKVGVREDVLVKAKKLYPHQLEQIRQRFQYARLVGAWDAYRGLLDDVEHGRVSVAEFVTRRRAVEQAVAERDARLLRYLDVVGQANEPSVLAADVSGELGQVAQQRFQDQEGRACALLEPFEFDSLAVTKGSLSSDERLEIESHVTHTFDFLSLIPWTQDLANLPRIAALHHEKLDGTGYPNRYTTPEIPVQSRMLTISDIYDALTAPDRPYKKGMPAEKALDILHMEARQAKIDSALLRVFVESGAFRAEE